MPNPIQDILDGKPCEAVEVEQPTLPEKLRSILIALGTLALVIQTVALWRP